MPHLAVFERIRLVDLYNNLQTHTENKFKVLSMMAEAKYGIRISAKRARDVIDKWFCRFNLGDRHKANKQKLFIKKY